MSLENHVLVSNLNRKGCDLLQIDLSHWKRSALSCWVFHFVRSNHQRCSIKKLFLICSENSQENTCDKVSFLIKLQTWAYNVLKKRLWHTDFYVNFAKPLRSPYLQNTSWRLFLFCRFFDKFFINDWKVSYLLGSFQS